MVRKSRLGLRRRLNSNTIAAEANDPTWTSGAGDTPPLGIFPTGLKALDPPHGLAVGIAGSQRSQGFGQTASTSSRQFLGDGHSCEPMGTSSISPGDLGGASQHLHVHRWMSPVTKSSSVIRMWPCENSTWTRRANPLDALKSEVHSDRPEKSELHFLFISSLPHTFKLHELQLLKSNFRMASNHILDRGGDFVSFF